MTLVTQKFTGIVNDQLSAPTNVAVVEVDGKTMNTEINLLEPRAGYARLPQSIAFLAKNVATGGARAIGYLEITDNNDIDGVDVFAGSNQFKEGLSWNKGVDAEESAMNLAQAMSNEWDFTVSVDGAIITLTAATAGTAGNFINLTSERGIDATSFSGGVDTTGMDGGSFQLTINGSWNDMGWGVHVDLSQKSAITMHTGEKVYAQIFNPEMMTQLDTVGGSRVLKMKCSSNADSESALMYVVVEYIEIKL